MIALNSLLKSKRSNCKRVLDSGPTVVHFKPNTRGSHFRLAGFVIVQQFQVRSQFGNCKSICSFGVANLPRFVRVHCQSGGLATSEDFLNLFFITTLHHAVQGVAFENVVTVRSLNAFNPTVLFVG